MSLRDEINRRTQLPKPSTPAKFEAIYTSSDDEENPSIITNRICKPKNPKLYNPDPEDFIDHHGDANTFPNELEITSSILEINGGDFHSNEAIEQRWKARVNQKQVQQKDDENKLTKKEVATKKSKVKLHNDQYKNNALMRNLLEQKMNDLKVSTSMPSSSNGGKNINKNNEPINGAMLTADLDDPDFFYLRDTTKKTEIIDDGFRFRHRGIKKVTTPRHYSVYETEDDDFIFRKKL